MWFEPKMKLWAYLFIVIIIIILLYYLTIVSTTSKETDLKFSAYSELGDVCLDVQIKQYPKNFYRHH